MLLCGTLMLGGISFVNNAMTPSRHFDMAIHNGVKSDKIAINHWVAHENPEIQDAPENVNLVGKISIPSIAFDEYVTLLGFGDAFLLAWTPEMNQYPLDMCKAGTCAYFDDGMQTIELICVSSFEENKMKTIMPADTENVSNENKNHVTMLYFRAVKD